MLCVVVVGACGPDNSTECPTAWTKGFQWIIQHTKGKTKIAKAQKMVYAEFIHTLWIERNVRIFERKAREIVRVSNQRTEGVAKLWTQQLAD